MIPVQKQPEPLDFQAKVVKRGKEFLRRNPQPKNWMHHSYWREALPDLGTAYRSICAYCCHWIPMEQGSASVDHFIPKSIAPNMAYEWDNFRLASLKMNAKKREATDVLDPFTLQPEWFTLRFPAMLVAPNPNLPRAAQDSIWATIGRLDLNEDEALVRSRLQWVLEFCDGRFDFSYLSTKAPFIALEIDRQNIRDELPRMFKTRRLT